MRENELEVNVNPHKRVKYVFGCFLSVALWVWLEFILLLFKNRCSTFLCLCMCLDVCQFKTKWGGSRVTADGRGSRNRSQKIPVGESFYNREE